MLSQRLQDRPEISDTAFTAPADGIYAFEVLIRWKRDETDLNNIPVVVRLLNNYMTGNSFYDRISVFF